MCRDCIDHVGRRETLGLERMQVQVHLNLALFAAVGEGRLGSFNGGKLSTNGIRTDVEQLLLVVARRRNAQLQHRDARGVVLDDEGGCRARRQTPQLHLADCAYLGHSAANVHMWLEEDFDDRDAVQRLRLNVLNIVHCRGHAALAVEGDAGRHLLSGEAGVLPYHRYDRDIYIRKNIRRHRQNTEGAKNQNQERKYGKGVGPPQRKPNNPHHRAGTRS